MRHARYRFAVEEVPQDLGEPRSCSSGADEQEAAELALCTLATDKSLAVLSRAGFSSDDLATVAAAATRIPGRPGLS